MSRRGKAGFWLVYLAAWAPYALSYYVLFRSLPTHAEALRYTAYNIIPAAVLGTLIVPWTSAIHWGLHRRWWFYPVQLCSAAMYSALWYAGVLLLTSVGQALITQHFRVGYFSSYALQWQSFSGLMVYCNIAGILYVFQVNEQLRREEHRRLEAEALRTTAELLALRARLNPHFVFNTLNSIMALAGPGQPRTMQAVAQLAAMLRYTLAQNSEDDGVSLRQELEFTDQYLALESLRFGERLQIAREIAPAALRCRLPPLTLQPLVENAVRHGIEPRAGLGTVRLKAWLEPEGLSLEIEDDGLGCEAGAVDAASGLGVRTVRQRLALFSGGAARFQVLSSPGSGCLISIALPQLPADSMDSIQAELSEHML